MPWLNLRDNISLYYEDRGKGIPLLFIHPPVLTGVNFRYQLDELSSQFRIIVPDLRGHGKSEYSPQPFTYSLIAQDIKELLDHLSIDRVFICGYSTGGSIALQFMLQEPKRVWGSVLMGGISEVMKNDTRLKKNISFAAKTADLGAGSTLAFIISSSNANNLPFFLELFKNAKQGSDRNMREYYQYSVHYNCTKDLTKIQAPVLLLYGEKDKDFIPYGHLLHKYLPSSTIKYIPGVKHQIPTKNHKETNVLIKQFIKKQTSI